jgi:hypothetical protein
MLRERRPCASQSRWVSRRFEVCGGSANFVRGSGIWALKSFLAKSCHVSGSKKLRPGDVSWQDLQWSADFDNLWVEHGWNMLNMLSHVERWFKTVQESLFVLSPTCIISVWWIERWMVSTRPEVTDALPSAFDGFNWPILTVWQLGFLFVNNIHEWEQITSIRSLECPRAIRGPDTRLWRIVTYKADPFWFDGCSCKRYTFIIFYNSDNRLDGS